MNFAEAESYLLSLGNEVLTMKLGLDNIRRLLETLGDPQNKYKKVQIAGTNGKGSVCAFLDAVCREAGIRTGVFTSPHLVSITERIKICGHQISEVDFASYATRVRQAVEALIAGKIIDTTPTFFEQVTAIGLLAFAESGVELAILETGLGGRLDATTAADAEFIGITQIDLDHQAILGNKLSEIAAEKAAVIHENCFVAAARQDEAAERVIKDRCQAVGVVPEWATTSLTISDHWDPSTAAKTTLSFETGSATYQDIRLGLPGRHQVSNAAVAIGLAEILQRNGFRIAGKHIERGLANAVHPGRLQFIGNVLLDGAHNVAAARALADYLDEFIGNPVVLVFGSMRDKNVRDIAAILFPRASTMILTKPQNERALSVPELAELVPSDGIGQKVFLTSNIEQAMATARQVADSDTIIVVTGSLYLVGEALKILNN